MSPAPLRVTPLPGGRSQRHAPTPSTRPDMNARSSFLNITRTTFALAVALSFSEGAFAQADEARARKIAGGSCFLCHGAQGESTSEVFPRLAGQHAEYTETTLKNFRDGARRNNASMQQIAARLSDAEIKALADFTQHLGQLLGVAMLKTHHPPVLR